VAYRSAYCALKPGSQVLELRNHDCVSQPVNTFGEEVMNKDQLQGDWKNLKGKIKEKWGKLTDDDLKVIEGKRDQLAGKLQERYGYAKEQAEKELEELCKECN
jgi:uncharacterized protein YjbJ (UPF0337 family)